MSKNNLKVFVYGTLKKGGVFSKRFDKNREKVKIGKIKGTMFSINNSFPGVVLNGKTIITGEVHEYSNAEEVERSLDNIEGFAGLEDPSNLYNKEIVEVETEDGTEICKMYTFARNLNNYSKIDSGVWEI